MHIPLSWTSWPGALALGLACAAAAVPAHAAMPGAPVIAVPYYQPQHLATGLLQHAYLPWAAGFRQEAHRLSESVEALCVAPAPQATTTLGAARRQWGATLVAWDRLSAVALGPLVERRSLRQIDFTPTRPPLIERAIRTAPSDAAGMERIGTPAKGLPALEWLLWRRQPGLGEDGCRYAVQVAADIEREAGALHQAFDQLARTPADEEASMLSDLVNQWVGGLERLRWTHIDKPLRSGAAHPRQASGLAAEGWKAQWSSLRDLAIQRGTTPPQPGQGLVSLEAYLRGRGLNPLADQLRQSALRADRSVARLTLTGRSAQQAAVRDLTALKHLVESQVAQALEVNIGFSDADGD